MPQPPDTEAARPPHRITIAEAAARAGVNPRTVRRWVTEERLPAYRVGVKLLRVDVDELDRFLNRPAADELDRFLNRPAVPEGGDPTTTRAAS